MDDDLDLSVEALISTHNALLGATFSVFLAMGLDEDVLTEKLKKAIQSEKPLTDKDLGIDIPKGALS